MSCRREIIAEANHADPEKVRCDKCYFAKEPNSFLGVVCTFWIGEIMHNDDFCSFWHDKKKKDNRKTFHCSFCKYSERSVRAKKFMFCPNCGAKMNEEEQEHEQS